MNLKGFIREIGQPRKWKTNEGEDRETYPLVLTIPYIGSDGKEHSDGIQAEHTCANPAYIANIRKGMDEKKCMEFRCGFSIKEWKNPQGQLKNIQQCKVYDIQMLMTP